MKLLARRALALLAWSPLLFTLTGCASQAEGERCDRRNGNLDCDPGLICAFIETSRDYICCPLTPSTNVTACTGATSGPRDSGTTSDGENRPDSGAETGAPDATRDPVSEAADDRSTVDTRADISPDISGDTSTVDIRPDNTARDAQDAPDDSSTTDRTPDGTDDTTSVDAPSIDVTPDAPLDIAGEASADVPLDNLTPVDAADSSDAPSADGPG
jgi:hypothetical protein